MSDPSSRRISQAQIAKELGYSQALISMALNGRKKGMSEATYQRIWEYATQHGYSPRGMKLDTSSEANSSTTIGYILRSPLKLANKSNFFSHIHQGLHDHLKEKKIKTIFLGSEDDIDEQSLTTPGSIPDSVRGIAIMGEVQPAFLASVKKLDRPVVYISARATGHCHSVLSNEQESGEKLVDHLYNLGHRKFAWLGGNSSMGRYDDRSSSLNNALRIRNLELDPQFSKKTKGADRKEGYDCAQEIISAAKKEKLPTAWVCLNGLMARGAINCLFQKGYRVGQDVSVVAFDMTNVCTEEHPTITGASAHPEEMGEEAARILLNSIEGEAKALLDVTIPAVMVERESSGSCTPVKTARKRA